MLLVRGNTFELNRDDLVEGLASGAVLKIPKGAIYLALTEDARDEINSAYEFDDPKE